VTRRAFYIIGKLSHESREPGVLLQGFQVTDSTPGSRVGICPTRRTGQLDAAVTIVPPTETNVRIRKAGHANFSEMNHDGAHITFTRLTTAETLAYGDAVSLFQLLQLYQHPFSRMLNRSYALTDWNDGIKHT
jgi:hypothetical protein